MIPQSLMIFLKSMNLNHLFVQVLMKQNPMLPKKIMNLNP